MLHSPLGPSCPATGRGLWGAALATEPAATGKLRLGSQHPHQHQPEARVQPTPPATNSLPTGPRFPHFLFPYIALAFSHGELQASLGALSDAHSPPPLTPPGLEPLSAKGRESEVGLGMGEP